MRTILTTIHDLKKLKIILLDNHQLKLFDQMKRPKIVFSDNISKKNYVDPGMKLLEIMKSSNCLDGSKNMTLEKIPEKIDEKLNFFNSIKSPL